MRVGSAWTRIGSRCAMRFRIRKAGGRLGKGAALLGRPTIDATAREVKVGLSGIVRVLHPSAGS